MEIIQNFGKIRVYLKEEGYSKQIFHFGRFEGGGYSYQIFHFSRFEGGVSIVKPPDTEKSKEYLKKGLFDNITLCHTLCTRSLNKNPP